MVGGQEGGGILGTLSGNILLLVLGIDDGATGVKERRLKLADCNFHAIIEVINKNHGS